MKRQRRRVFSNSRFSVVLCVLNPSRVITTETRNTRRNTEVRNGLKERRSGQSEMLEGCLDNLTIECSRLTFHQYLKVFTNKISLSETSVRIRGHKGRVSHAGFFGNSRCWRIFGSDSKSCR